MSTDHLPIQSYYDYGIMTTLEAFTNKPQVWPELRKSFGMGILDFDIIGTLKGSTKTIASETYTVEEEMPPWRTLTIGAGSSVGTVPGGVATIKLAAGDIDQYGNYYPQVKQEVTLGSAEHKAVCVITAITPNSTTDVDLTVYPKDTAVTLDATYIATGLTGTYAPAVNRSNESSAVSPTAHGWRYDTYYLETIKGAKAFGDSEFAREGWVRPDGKNLWNKAVADLDMELDATMEMKIHTGEKNLNTSYIKDTSLASGSTSMPIYGTQGIWNWIKDRGTDVTFTSATDFPIEYFYKFAEYGETVGLIDGDWMFNAGGELLRRVEKSCRSYLINSTGTMSDMFLSAGQGGNQNLSVGFDSIRVGSQRFYLKKNHIFTNPYFLGALPGFNEAAEVFPLMEVRERKSQSLVPNLHLVYRGLGQYKRNRIMQEFAGMGGALKQMVGTPITLTSDISQLHALVEFGVAFLEAWRGVRVYRTDI